MDRAGADDEPGRARAGAPAVERGVGGRDDRRVLGEAEVVVRRERDDGAAVGRELALGARGVEVHAAPRHCPALVDHPGLSRRRSRRPAQLTSPRQSVTSSIASASAWTMRCSSSEVIGQRRHQDDDVAERAEQHARARTAAAHDRRPHRSPSAGGASSTPPIRPRSRTSATSGSDTMRSSSRPRSSSERARTLASTSYASMSSRWRSATAAAERVPAVRVPVVQRALGQVGAEERVEHPPRRHRRRHREVPGGQALAEAQQVGPDRPPAPTRTACRCDRSRSRPRRRSAGRRGSRHAAASAARSSGAASCMPAAPCTSGSTITAASSCACSRHHRARARRSSPDRANAGARSTGKRSGSKRSVPNPPAPTRERADRVAVVRVAEAEEACVRPVIPRFTQYWNAILSACSTAHAPSDA